MPIQSPRADGRSLDEVESATRALAEAYSGWKPPPAGSPDMGSALIRVFARMAKHVIDRVDRVPDRSFLAFLNLIGVEPQPPLAASVPLTFSLAKGSSAEPLVPKGTRVGAAPSEGDPREVVFETDRDLVLTRSKLVAVMVRSPPTFADRTAEATGAAEGYYDVFVGQPSMEHSLYLAADDILGLPAGTAVTLALDTSDPVAWQGLVDLGWVEWTYWNGQTWSLLPISSSTTPSLTFERPHDQAAVAVDGKTARWIRARFTGFASGGPNLPVPAILGLSFSASVIRSGLAPDEALSGGRPVDVSMDFFPFGERPRFNDTFHLASEEALSLPGSSVTVTLAPSAVMAPALRDTDAPLISWEVWTGSVWQKVLATSPTTANNVAQNDALRTVTLTLPAELAPAAVQGIQGRWLRARLAAGDFGKGIVLGKDQSNAVTVVDDGYRPPIFESVTLSVAHTVTTGKPVLCIAGDDRGFVDHTGEASFVPFIHPTDTKPELYLGFDRPFSERPVLLYIQVAPSLGVGAGPSAPNDIRWEVVWEYSSAATWAPLRVTDGTGGFVRSGLVELLGPEDFTPRLELGKSLYWIRARLEQGDVARRPFAGLVLTNTVLATHVATTEGTGGGMHGNRPKGVVQQLKTTIPYVESVTNWEGASGGADAESLERTQERGPRTLRHGGRAVTCEDFEDLAKEASPEVARARALSPLFDPMQQVGDPSDHPVTDAGVVTLLIVPNSDARPPAPSRGLLSDVESYLRARCSPAVRLRLAGPQWIQAIVRIKIIPVSFDGSDALRTTVEQTLHRFFDPFTGGPAGAGWALGEVPHASDVYRVLSAIDGVNAIQSLVLWFSASPSEDSLLYEVFIHRLQILAPAGGG